MARLLIVDDDSDLSELLADAFRAEGHDVTSARNGLEGLRMASEHLPDLVLLDVEMPVLDGPEMAYEMVLRDCGSEKIPVVLLSGTVGLERIAAAVGTPYYIAKPCDIEAVLAMVQRALVERIPPRPHAREGGT